MNGKYAEKNVAISGIGQSEVGRPSSKSALRLTVDACLEAIRGAGLEKEQIDGIASYPGIPDDGSGFSPVNVVDIRLALGLSPKWYAALGMDSPGQLSAIFEAIHAIASGTANNVLVFRSSAEASARKRDKGAINWSSDGGQAYGMWQWTAPFGVPSPAPWYALYAQRHFHQYGTTEEQLGQIAVNNRAMASRNPTAIYQARITLDDYLSSTVISSPLRIYDCDVPVDGATAFVLSRADAVRRSGARVLRFEAIGSAIGPNGLRNPDNWTSFGAEAAAAMMWSRTDLKPSDMQVGQIYDGFSILTLHWLEALGICKRGEAGSFVEGGRNIGLDGILPMNTGGGQLSAGRLHGFGHLHEACVQLLGRGGLRQVTGDPSQAVVCCGAYGLGCAVLVRE